VHEHLLEELLQLGQLEVPLLVHVPSLVHKQVELLLLMAPPQQLCSLLGLCMSCHHSRDRPCSSWCKLHHQRWAMTGSMRLPLSRRAVERPCVHDNQSLDPECLLCKQEECSSSHQRRSCRRDRDIGRCFVWHRHWQMLWEWQMRGMLRQLPGI